MDAVVTVGDEVSDEFRALLWSGIAGYNLEQAGSWDYQPMGVLVRDPVTGAPLGGLAGWTALGLAFIDLVWLPPDLRGGGMGRDILRRAEAEALRRGCRAAVLFTASWQAPGFYARHGWEEFGRIDCDPPGAARVWFRKQLG